MPHAASSVASKLLIFTAAGGVLKGRASMHARVRGCGLFFSPSPSAEGAALLISISMAVFG